MSHASWNRKAPVLPAASAFPALGSSMPQKPKPKSAAMATGARKFKHLSMIDPATGKESVATTCPHCKIDFTGIGPCPRCGSADAPSGFCWTGTSWNGDLRGYVVGSDLATESYNSSFEKACQLKNSLLKYQQEEVKRTRVIDDSCDWYDLRDNPWLSKKERQFAACQARRREDEEQSAKHLLLVDIDLSVGKVTDCTAHAAGMRRDRDQKDLQQFLDRQRRQ